MTFMNRGSKPIPYVAFDDLERLEAPIDAVGYNHVCECAAERDVKWLDLSGASLPLAPYSEIGFQSHPVSSTRGRPECRTPTVAG
ncbi:hypothetical protein A6U98_02970 [Rhizobium sp. WYCCWR10014]|nr:hypothetical protein A6U98_02970 [Rhizobium sp. WYCCWR10014]